MILNKPRQVQSLFEIAHDLDVINGRPLIDDVSIYPDYIVDKILKASSPEELNDLEYRAKAYEIETDELWKKHCLYYYPYQYRPFPPQVKTWKDKYYYLKRENNLKVKNMTMKMDSAVKDIIKQKDLTQTRISNTISSPLDRRRNFNNTPKLGKIDKVDPSKAKSDALWNKMKKTALSKSKR